MEKVRRAIALWLARLAKTIYRPVFMELTVPPPAPPRQDIRLTEDQVWADERISQLHIANRKLFDTSQRWEDAYRIAMTYTRRGKRDQVALAKRLRELFARPY